MMHRMVNHSWEVASACVASCVSLFDFDFELITTVRNIRYGNGNANSIEEENSASKGKHAGGASYPKS